jgi:hypothetical protein
MLLLLFQKNRIMKKIFILFVTISLNVFSQDYKLINQKLYQYNDRKYVIEHDGSSEYGQYLMEELPYIEVATDDSLSMVISDSLTKRYGTKKYVNENQLSKNAENLAIKLALDSSINVVLYKVRGDCGLCKNSLIDVLINDNDLIKLFQSSRVTEVYTNYYQIKTPLKNTEVMYITVKRRFGFDYIFILYSEK